MKTVLLLESDPTRRVVLALILRGLGYTVLETGSRGEVWSACNQEPGPIHLVILDDDDSSDFVVRLHIVCPQIRTLLLSDASQMQLAGMPCECAVVQRPFRVDVLADTIRGLLDRPRERAA